MKYTETMEMLRKFEALCKEKESIHFYIGFIQSNLAELIESGNRDLSVAVISQAIKDLEEEAK